MKLPYELLAAAFKAAVKDNKFADDPRIKIVRGPTGLGKSFFQDKEMPVILKNVFPDLKYIIRVSPTTEVADDGTFVDVDLLSDDETLYQYYNNLDPTTVRNIESLSKRTDIVAAAHAHALYGKTWSAHKKLLSPLTQDACAFFDDHSLYDEYNGVVYDTNEGDRIAKSLGNNKAVTFFNNQPMRQTQGPCFQTSFRRIVRL